MALWLHRVLQSWCLLSLLQSFFVYINTQSLKCEVWGARCEGVRVTVSDVYCYSRPVPSLLPSSPPTISIMRQQRSLSSEWLLLGQTKVVQQHKHLCAPFVELNTAKPGVARSSPSNNSVILVLKKKKTFLSTLSFSPRDERVLVGGVHSSTTCAPVSC